MIPPLRLAPQELLNLPRPPKPQPWEKLSYPTYWFGDRLLTNKGWGICSGIKKITGGWLYYIDLDEPPRTQIFAETEIIKHHVGKYGRAKNYQDKNQKRRY